MQGMWVWSLIGDLRSHIAVGHPHPRPVAQTGKSLLAMQETQVRSLGEEDPLEKGMATLASCLENSMGRESWQATAHGVVKSQTQLSD